MTKIKMLLVGLMILGVSEVWAQQVAVKISGTIRDKGSQEALPYVNVVLKSLEDSMFVAGTISNEKGSFTLVDVPPDEYLIQLTSVGYEQYVSRRFIGSNSAYIDLGTLFLNEGTEQLSEVVITGQQDAVTAQMDKKTYQVDANVSQTGGSVLQAMNNLPGVTTQDGQVQLRGNDRVVVLIDGKQTAITGFGNQNGLDNLPASAIQKIEIINNPSAKYDANGNAGIINILLKKEEQTGLNGKVGLSTGVGALWVRQDNLPGIRPQYQATPKINPSVALNYRKKKVNVFLQADNLYTETLNKNEFVTRKYSDGTVINQQLKRNRNTNLFTSTAGMDWFMNDHNQLTISGFFSQESIKDYGDQPFFDGNTDENLRLWQFLEDEVLTAVMTSLAYEHQFEQPGHQLKMGFNYTFDREDEKYFFDNTRPSFSTQESFFLIADQKVADFTLDYTRPMKYGLLQTGLKFRHRTIPTDMQFNPSASNSVLDTGADGLATYREIIPAVYGNFTYEVQKLEAEIGLRVEYVDLAYDVDPNHNTYQSDGYQYFQPFPSARLTYKLNEFNNFSAFYNRRVDRPDEVDIRIFPKYDDAEIIKVGNPALQPQFTNSFEIGYKSGWQKGYVYSALYRKISDGTITRIASTVDGSNLIYNISQNAGKSYNTGLEVVVSQEFSDVLEMNLNLNGYYNRIEQFSVDNLYPTLNTFTAQEQDVYSGNVKLNTNLTFGNKLMAQLTMVYLAPDIIPQGKIESRFSVDLGVKKSIQAGKGELYVNANDLFNTLVIRKQVNGDNFTYTSSDYYETQVVRLGYNYKF